MKYIKMYEENNHSPIFNIGDLVKIVLDEYKLATIRYDSEIFKIINYQIKNISLPIPTIEIYELDLIYGDRTVNPFWIRGYQLRLATDDEINYYLIKKDANKYNL